MFSLENYQPADEFRLKINSNKNQPKIKEYLIQQTKIDKIVQQIGFNLSKSVS